jgi:predicted nucleic acid-binding protein
MKNSYWDSSALVEATSDLDLRIRVRNERPKTRPHSLAEIFSALTGGGNLGIRVDANEATASIKDLAQDLEFVELSASEMLAAFETARSKGVRGGRVHDYLHAVAAIKSNAVEIVTVDENDFDGLSQIKVSQLP